jgi:hypothetical protein
VARYNVVNPFISRDQQYLPGAVIEMGPVEASWWLQQGYITPFTGGNNVLCVVTLANTYNGQDYAVGDTIVLDSLTAKEQIKAGWLQLTNT